MTADRWQDDDQLLADLAEAVRATDPMTDRIRRLGAEVPLYRRLDEDIELALLTYDSAMDPALVARNGGAAEYRTLLFQARSGQVQIEAVGHQVIGQVMPSLGGTVSIDARDGTVATADVDDTGCFQVQSVPAGLLRVVWTAPSGVLATEWARWF
jgi:erythromycin esterase-like protein